jgi:hypothetical protein
MGEFYERFAERGANIFGFMDGGESAKEESNFSKSKAICNGQFAGKMFDGKSQADDTFERAVSSIVASNSAGSH